MRVRWQLMRWGRGFFRLWIVVALLWASYAAYQAHATTEKMADEAAINYVENSGGAMSCRGVVESGWLDCARTAPGYREKFNGYYWELLGKGWFLYCALAVIPPLTLLVLGFVVGRVSGWMGRGFQSAKGR